MTDHPSALVSVPRDDDQRPFSDSLLPEAMIYAGSDALDRAQMDMANYVSGETIDWDHGMIAVAVYRAMLAAAPAAPQAAGVGEDWTTLADLHTIKGWLHGLSTAPDLTEVVADGGVSAGDVYQQEAREFAGRLGRIIEAMPAFFAPSREPEGGAVDYEAVRIATDLHTAFERLIYGLPKYLDAENLTDEENMIREAWITLDVTAHRLAALAALQAEQGAK